MFISLELAAGAHYGGGGGGEKLVFLDSFP